MRIILLLFCFGLITACGARKEVNLPPVNLLNDTSESPITTAQMAANKAMVMQLHQAVWSNGNIALIEMLYSEDIICHVPLDQPWTTLERLKQDVTAHRKAFPDWKEEVIDLIAEGEQVVSRYRVSGTQQGTFWDIAPTGNTVEMEEVVIFRFKNGKIAEQWSFPNLYEYRRQLLKKQE